MKLLDYIQGLRKGKEAHRLEKESMKDPFLADALDGFQQVQGDHASKIEQLRQQVSSRTSRQRRMSAWGWSVAACLLVGVGVGGYYLLFLQKDIDIQKVETLVRTTPVIQLEDTLPAITGKDTVQAIIPKQDHRRDIIAKVQEPPLEEMDALEMKEIQVTPNKIQVASSTTPQTQIKLSQPAAQKEIVQGKVIDENGEPIIGASVYYKGTNIGTITDTNGEFSLKKNNRNQVLTAQYIGYDSVNLPIDSSRNMLIAMNTDKTKLEEVVVIGYGRQKKSTLTGRSIETNFSSKVPNNTKDKEPVPLIGKKEFKKYLKENLIRPTDEACKGCEGKVTVTFFVDSNGKPQHIIVTESLCESADKEAIRLIQEGPKWTVSQLPVTVEIKF